MPAPYYRRGFTLVEMLLALLLATFVGGIALSILTRQQRLARGLETMMAVREPLRDAVDVLTVALRGTAVMGDTLQFASDTAIELFVTIGASTLCAPASAATLSLPPTVLASGATLTAWFTTPDTGDYALVFHDSSAATPTRYWERLRVTTVTQHPVMSVCPQSPFVAPADSAAHAQGYTTTLATPVSSAVPSGIPIRFVRRGRYSMYRASDRLWYLGYRRCGVTCEGIQPVSGPYQGGSAAPLTLRYYRSDGTLLSPNGPATGIARVDIMTRAQSAEQLQIPGVPAAVWGDSVMTSVAFRNHQ